MFEKETETIEFKREATNDLKKEITAFLNTSGGKIYVGVDDDGKVVGVYDEDKVSLKICSMIRDAVKPDATMFADVKSIYIDGRCVVEIDVRRGSNAPYYLTDKGMKPSGVYVRQGTASVPASENKIRDMIKDMDGGSYEQGRSFDQELTFEYAEKEFAKRNIAFGKSQMRTNFFTDNDGLYTNLAYLMSDQCEGTIKAAVFQDETKRVFRNRREFSGSLLKQLDEAYGFINQYNSIIAKFEGLERIDYRDYPIEAIREALINAVTHRDYALSGSTLINIYSNRIEIVSIGGLVYGLSVNDIELGVSRTRNEKLAACFYRLRLIEAYGTGIMKIRSCYEKNFAKPEIKISDHAFMIVLPKFDYDAPINNNARKVLEHLRAHEFITRREAQELTGLSQSGCIKLLRELCENGKIEAVGNGMNRKYKINGRI